MNFEVRRLMKLHLQWKYPCTMMMSLNKYPYIHSILIVCMFIMYFFSSYFYTANKQNKTLYWIFVSSIIFYTKTWHTNNWLFYTFSILYHKNKQDLITSLDCLNFLPWTYMLVQHNYFFFSSFVYVWHDQKKNWEFNIQNDENYNKIHYSIDLNWTFCLSHNITVLTY